MELVGDLPLSFGRQPRGLVGGAYADFPLFKGFLQVWIREILGDGGIAGELPRCRMQHPCYGVADAGAEFPSGFHLLQDIRRPLCLPHFLRVGEHARRAVGVDQHEFAHVFIRFVLDEGGDVGKFVAPLGDELLASEVPAVSADDHVAPVFVGSFDDDVL